jgi:hypothetical protein
MKAIVRASGLLLLGGALLRAGDLEFSLTVPGTRKLSAAVDDIDGDGWVEPLGTWNDGQGTVVRVPLRDMGLDALFGGGRQQRDARVADFDGDGLLDVLANTYACATADSPPALLFLNTGGRTFTEQPGVRALSLRGRGETIVAADFDDDGDLDAFLPFYTFDDPACPNAPRNALLRNDGGGTFTDVAVGSGLEMANWPAGLRPEGAQAIDIDADGRLDLYVASHFFINQGGLVFQDRRQALGLPLAFDEGIRFVDWNNDGRMDLVLHHELQGPRLFEFDGSLFHERTQAADGSGRPFFSSGPPAYAPLSFAHSYGISAADLDGDGREDLLVAGDTQCGSTVLVNRGDRFERARPGEMGTYTGCAGGWGSPTGADLNRDGWLDVVYPGYGGIRAFTRRTSSPALALSIELRGDDGRRNQHGRLVRIRPRRARQGFMTRLVDGGSGLMGQNPYGLLVPTPHAGPHRVVAFFGPAGNGSARRVAFRMRAGQHAQVHADGTVVIGPQPAAGPPPPAPPPERAGVYRPDNATFYLSGVPGSPPIQVPFGAEGDLPVVGDWDGDGTATIGIYRPATGEFHLRNSNTAGPADHLVVFPGGGGLPVAGNWQGLGSDWVGVYQPADSTFHLIVPGSGVFVLPFGQPGDLPVVGDFDGNGVTTVGVYRPAQNRFLLRNCNVPGAPDLDVPYGIAGDLPVVGDFDGNGTATIGVYRPSDRAFYLRQRNEPGMADVALTFGDTGDAPLLGVWEP